MTTEAVYQRVVGSRIPLHPDRPYAMLLLLECGHEAMHDPELPQPERVRCSDCEGVPRGRPRRRVVSVPPSERRGPRRKG